MMQMSDGHLPGQVAAGSLRGATAVLSEFAAIPLNRAGPYLGDPSSSPSSGSSRAPFSSHTQKWVSEEPYMATPA